MDKEKIQWRSPSLGKDMELIIYGSSGTPVIGIPTRGGSCHQWEKFGMVNAISYQLKNGFNKLYCISSVDKESFLNDKITPSQRLVRHQQFESYLVDEVVPYLKDHNPIDYTIIAGTDLGGYHAITTALKHPTAFDRAIGMSGVYDIKRFMDDYYENDLYYNNPMDFVPNINKQSLLNDIRDVDFRLVSYEEDPRREYGRRLSNIFSMKFIEHELDIWNLETTHEWDQWPQMLKTHII